MSPLPKSDHSFAQQPKTIKVNSHAIIIKSIRYAIKQVICKFQFQIKPIYSQNHYNLRLQQNQLMWNLISASKLTEEKVRRKNYEMHREKVASMKAKMQIRQPEQPEFVYMKPKLEMSRRDKLTEIDRQNDILLTKMQTIKSAKYTQNKLRPEAQQLKTLNQHIMILQAEDIYNENKRICSKLLKINSHYPTFETIDKAERLENIGFNISENARRVMSAKNLHTRPQSSYTSRSSKFYRSRLNKFDNEGNSQEKINVLYKMISESDLRPESAPSSKRSHNRRYESAKPTYREQRLTLNQEEQQNRNQLDNYETKREGQLQNNEGLI